MHLTNKCNCVKIKPSPKKIDEFNLYSNRGNSKILMMKNKPRLIAVGQLINNPVQKSRLEKIENELGKVKGIITGLDKVKAVLV